MERHDRGDAPDRRLPRSPDIEGAHSCLGISYAMYFMRAPNRRGNLTAARHGLNLFRFLAVSLLVFVLAACAGADPKEAVLESEPGWAKHSYEDLEATNEPIDLGVTVEFRDSEGRSISGTARTRTAAIAALKKSGLFPRVFSGTAAASDKLLMTVEESIGSNRAFYVVTMTFSRVGKGIIIKSYEHSILDQTPSGQRSGARPPYSDSDAYDKVITEVIVQFLYDLQGDKVLLTRRHATVGCVGRARDRQTVPRA